MKLLKISAAITALILSASLPVYAGGKTTTFGKPDCGEWLKDPASHRRAWLLGFMSGINFAWNSQAKTSLDPLDELTSAQQAYVWMDNYCQKNPLKDVGDGAVELFLELVVKRTNKNS